MKTQLGNTLSHCRHGVRLYIGIAIVIVTLESWWWASVTYGGSNLFAIRLEEFYAWLSLGLLTTAIAIGPFYKVFARVPGKAIMSDARRLIGVGAAWFASLHVAIAYDSLFKFANPLELPRNYLQSFSLGAIALIVLLAMAFTSFDRAFHGMGVWWFRLHRFVYVAALFTLLHAFMIGTHATQGFVLIILLAISAAIFALHSYIALGKPQRPTKWQLLALMPALLFLIAAFGYGFRHKDSQKQPASQVQQS